MNLPEIDIAREDGGWPAEAELMAMARKAVSAAAEAAALEWPEGAELSLVFTGDDAIAGLNGQWRGKPKPTNVLSFPGSDIRPGEPSEMMIGDIVLARETCEREALEQGKRFEDHVVHLLVHGFLHLFGHDHVDDADARIMEDLERKALSTLGIGDPYAYLPE